MTMPTGGGGTHSQPPSLAGRRTTKTSLGQHQAAISHKMVSIRHPQCQAHTPLRPQVPWTAQRRHPQQLW
jgi:hypothetical protein